MAEYSGRLYKAVSQDTGNRDYKSTYKLGQAMNKNVEFPNRYPRDNQINKLAKGNRNFREVK